MLRKLSQIKISLFIGLFLILLASANKVKAGATTYTWTGTTSTEWNLASNWGGIVPTSAENASIPASPSGGRFPTISSGSGTVACRDIAIASGATVTQTGGILQFSHDWKNSGTYSGTGGTIQFTGVAGGGADWTTATSNQFFNVIIDIGMDPGFYNDPNGVLSVAGNWTDNNTVALLIDNAYTVTFNGTGAQTITSSRGTNNSFINLAIDNTSAAVTLASS